MIKPHSDIIIVKPLTGEELRNGIIIPATVDRKILQGEIVAAGPGRRLKNGDRVKMSVSVGQKVVYYEHIGLSVDVDGVECLGMRETDLLGVAE